MKEKQKNALQRCVLFQLTAKIPNAMKLTFLFLVITLLSFSAAATAQHVSISVDNAKVEQVLTSITKQTGLSVAYSKQIVDLNRRVSISMANADVKQVLDKLIENTGLDYEIKENKIYLFEKGES
ncbi:STN domain-containing protein, partial [Parabacteroides sp. OttesenSCG-928-K15]|nr:STN domain-containing protein [Parabacteroides sp. OttesenSCG-928-K15]